jgi:signal transduction histidine kinase
MPDGGVLTVGLEALGDSVRISVRDTGTGFDPRATARIFEPFQSGFAGGTGLGLAIVYQILQAHKGHIRVETEPGLGTEFVVEIPRSIRSTARPVPRLVPDAARTAGPLVGKV